MADISASNWFGFLRLNRSRFRQVTKISGYSEEFEEEFSASFAAAASLSFS